MAPEVLSSNVTDVLATDIWAVGITLYVMLAGFLPWQEVSTLRQPSFPPFPFSLTTRRFTEWHHNRLTPERL